MVGTRSSRRMAAGGFGLAAIACAGALAFGGQAMAATTVYPAGGSNFDDGSQGWTSSDTSCSFPLIPAGLCTSAPGHDPSGGNPGGAIEVEATVVINLLGLFNAQATWTSPPFTVPAGTPVAGATFQYDRRFEAGGLLALDPDPSVVTELVDDTAVTVTPLVTDGPTSAAAYETQSVGVAGGAVVPGHTYRLRLRSVISSSVASIGLLGTSTLGFDNVRLSVSDGANTGGPNPGPNPEIEVIDRTLTDRQISELILRYGINSEVGKGEGGSLIPRAECTIIGTPGPDRIVGTPGNDVICGRGGNDVILGGGGRDVIDGGDGSDRLNGGPGGDLLLGLRGNDRGNGGAGNDAIGGGAGRDILSGGAGKDRISGRSGNDRIAGNGGADRLAGAAGRDRLNGGGGHDRIAGGAGADRIGARDRTRDVVLGGGGRDTARVDSAAGSSKRAARRADRVRGVERLR